MMNNDFAILFFSTNDGMIRVFSSNLWTNGRKFLQTSLLAMDQPHLLVW